MNLKYRITIEGIKGFYRIYVVNSENTLYTFHKQLRADLEFPIDQPILFKAFAKDGSVAARYALIDLGSGSVDKVTIGDTVKAGIDRFIYFYDTAARKSVTVTLEGEYTGKVFTVAGTVLPFIIDTKGPLPIDFENGYVAFEDLPQEQRHLPGERKQVSGDEDDEDLDDQEDDDDEDGEEEDDGEELVYDGDN